MQRPLRPNWIRCYPVILLCLLVLAVPRHAEAIVIQIDGTTVPGPAPGGERPLQDALNVGEGLASTATNNPLQAVDDAATVPELFTIPTDGDGNYVGVRFIMLQHWAGCVNAFGWYNAADPTTRFQVFVGNEIGTGQLTTLPGVPWEEGCAEATGCTVVDFEEQETLGHYSGGAIGFYLYTSSGCGSRLYYTQSELNADGNYVHYLVYGSLVDVDEEGRPLAYYFGFEDLFRGGDNDFSDSTFKVEGLTQPCSPSAEICDGRDNDCNGTIDDVDYGDEVCAPDEYPDGWDPYAIPANSACQGGQYACVQVSANVFQDVCQNAPLPAATDECDGVDNDCDGQLDEDFEASGYSLTSLCDAGMLEGECDAELICEGGAVQCSETVGPLSEICDGLDNDCNGTSDDGSMLDVGVPCACEGVVDVDGTTLVPPGACDGLTAGTCGVGATVCADGVLTCDGWDPPGAETCNGLDDDCDGVIDNSPTDTGLGVSCTPTLPEGTLLCTQGHYECVNGVRACTGFTTGSPELCDGLDNDCDGTADDSPIDVGQPCGSNVGVCTAGVYVCNTSGQRICGATQLPSQEVCDGLDNDCDGVVDDGATGGNLGNSCGAANSPLCAGTVQCVAGAEACVSPNPGTPELCDGVDNDCDGLIDNDPLGVGQSCGSEVGECMRGTLRCEGTDATDTHLVCSGGVDPQPETCDGADNDCDGLVDEELYGSDGIGPTCALDGSPQCTGTTVCVDGQEVCNVTSQTSEVCNGVDDDCDGTIDEGATDVGAVCSTSLTSGGDAGACEFGQWACVPTNPGDASTNQRICQGEVGPSDEVCDGLDNDCDGLIDNDYDGTNPAFTLRGEFEGASVAMGASCSAEGCSNGAYVCLNGEVICDIDSVPAIEYCDGEDNNCDGNVDEADALVDVGTACQTLALSCGAGVWTCEDGGLVCSGEIPGSAEICDGLDNDCNGVVDDGNLGGIIGSSCALAGQPQCTGTWFCLEGEETCAVNSQTPELCDGVDNDCDGVVDDDPTDIDLPCATSLTATTGDTGLCEYGQWDCVPSTPDDPTSNRRVCIDEVGPAPERCDGLDNDCDGFVDNDTDGDAGSFVVQGDFEGQEVSEGEDCTVTESLGAAGAGNVSELAAQCLSGAFTCRDGAMVCDMLVDVTAERCDGVDNDCDDLIDEPDALVDVGTSCTTAPFVCSAGVWTCTDGELTCEGEEFGTAEVCDGLDNDCDGVIDNPPEGGFEGEGEPCMPEGIDAIPNPDTSMCREGELRCHNGALSCVGAIGPWAEEVCDGLDNDCDGTADNQAECPVGTVCHEGECKMRCGSGEFPCPGAFSCNDDGFCEFLGSSDGSGGAGGGFGSNGGAGGTEDSSAGSGHITPGAAGSAGSDGTDANSEDPGAGNDGTGEGSNSTGASSGNDDDPIVDTNGDGNADHWGLATGGGGCRFGAGGRGPRGADLALFGLLLAVSLARRSASRKEHA